MFANDTATVGIFYLAITANDDFGSSAFDVDQVDMIAMMIFERQFQRTAINLYIPVQYPLPSPFLGAKAQLLQPILHGIIVIVARFMMNLQQHRQLILS